jgi:hypothetical protein
MLRSEPVADLGSTTLDVLSEHQADSADRLSPEVDDEIGPTILMLDARQPVDRVGYAIWMGHAVAQVYPHAPVVCVLRQRLRIQEFRYSQRDSIVAFQHRIG